MAIRDPFSIQEDYTCDDDDDDLLCLDAGDNGGVCPLQPFNGDNSLSVEDYTCDDDVLFLDAGDNGGVCALQPFTGDNSFSVEGYTCNNILSHDDGGDNGLDGVNSVPPEGFTGNHDGDISVPSGGNIVPQDWRMIIPLGMKFRPTDEELVINYLELESFGVTSPSDGIINRLDVYDYQPHQLPSMAVDHGDGKMYFYTYVKKIGKSKNDRKIKPRPGCHWKATQAPKPIKGSRSGAIHGYKMPLAYYEEEDKKTQWLMQEYKLKSQSSSPKEHDLVLAVIYYHHRKRRGEDENN